MEWKIVVPVLCLIGFLPVPGNAADTNSTNNSSTAFELNIVFHIEGSFIDAYSNMANNDTINLKNKIISEVKAVYSHLKNFERFDILRFSNGSIVVDGKLHFNSSDSKPTSANLTQILNTGNFTFKILTNLTRITDVPTTTAPATTVSTPAKLAAINIVFRINQIFKDIYSNPSDPETKQLTENITSAFTAVYKKLVKNFLRMRIQKFSPGSIVVDSVFEFDNTNNTSPNVTEVKNTFIDAIKTGNFSFSVDIASINATDITTSETTTTQATTTSVSVERFNLTFKMMRDFTNDLSNMSSSAATNLTITVIDQLDKVFKTFVSHRRTFVKRFRNGSIAVDAELEFNKVSSPTAATLAKSLADGVRNGVVNLQIDTKTIQVTDSTGATANKSPVLASMLTAFWMTLASLLLSAVMH